MNSNTVVVEGIVNADGTLQVEGKLSLPQGRVRVTVVPVLDLPQIDPFWQRMQSIWDDQQKRDRAPRDAAVVEAERRAARAEMEQEIQEAMRLQQECRQARQRAEAQEPSA